MTTAAITVCGTGIAGLATALALARRGQPVSLLGPRRVIAPAVADEYCPRVYAISPASQAFLYELGVWEALPEARVAAVQAMDIRGDGRGRVDLHAWQAARSELAWIVESSELERALAQAVRVMGIAWLDDRLAGYENGILHTEGGARLHPSLAVAADGAASPLRTAAGLRVDSRPYGAIGLVAHLDAERPHGGTAFQWFGADGVLALLPMPDTARGAQVSMVWSMKAQPAQALLALPPGQQAEALAQRLRQATEGCLGALAPRTTLLGFALTLDISPMIAPGLALVGDAAHRIHPLAGQGLNLGLGDAQALAETVAAREPWREPGDPAILRRYRRRRAQPVLEMRLATDGLHRLFDAAWAPLGWLRNAGMQWVNGLPGLKRQLIARASQ